ncbi:lipoate--protein ligase family protein [Macrococcus equipercicus]|uniref:Octanoyl-[GcvH]:protein N-octanoyltransferase n=1 Tax=Macrococcus equipercicus TaxID=69967 RepID=A0A9Q9F181_9STAP|nr:lipoate--protein ligase family protein [Macrococcus equipercicus]UTH13647.1 lipoate--protein ligase family protein [Macrococcus equipercicus]
MNLFHDEWQYVDHTTGLQPMQSFSFDDTFCHLTGTLGWQSVVRTWVHQHVVILGIHDSRLPHLKDGIRYLNDAGYGAIVRNSGGLGVVLDSGVLNISLIFNGGRSFSIDAGYDLMYELVKEMFKDAGVIAAKEIAHSYCPGSYDLSIDGRKFAGISQRRVRGGVAVQIYLCVEGSGSARAELMRDFYEQALQNEETKFSYPDIHPEDMASLSELLQVELTVEDVLFKLLAALKSLGAALTQKEMTDEVWSLYNDYFDRMIERNDKMIKNMKDVSNDA